MVTDKKAIGKLFPRQIVRELNGIVRQADGVAPKSPKGNA
jgi:hypothetical protein